VTAFIYLIFRPLCHPLSYWLDSLHLSKNAAAWVYTGPGGAIFGLLPSVVCVLLGGQYLFGVTIREQWNGRLQPRRRDLWYGGIASVAMSAFFLCGIAATGQGRIAWEPNWAGHGQNLFSNLYEELLARGLLLQVTRRTFGNWFGIFWTAVVFGTMHQFGWFALGVAATTWIFAWVILRSGSLWSGYICHQGLDFFMDSLLH
jgi:membrane protease YdiL (CAAX protease family)